MLCKAEMKMDDGNITFKVSEENLANLRVMVDLMMMRRPHALMDYDDGTILVSFKKHG
jgi:hypothetical protein